MSKAYGYCRISTHKQNIERQVRNIIKFFPDAMIIQEIFTGSKFQGRKELDKLVKSVKYGDTIIFDSVSRMIRNADDGFKLYQKLYNIKRASHQHVNLQKNASREKIALNLNSGDEATNALVKSILDALNDYILTLARRQIQLAFEQSQKEVEDLHQRTREGIETTRRSVKQIGQKFGKKLNIKKKFPIQQLILKYSKHFRGTNSDREVIAIINMTADPNEKSRKLHVSLNTYYEYKSELKFNNEVSQ